MYELTIALKTDEKTPLYEQIYHHIRGEIESGALQTGEKLPSTRALAVSLSVSRSTTELAYNQLFAEGYIEIVPYKGCYVSRIDGLYVAPTEKGIVENTLSVRYEKPKAKYDFSPYGIDLERFPLQTWQRLSKEVLLNEQSALFQRGEEQGEQKLRESISSYLYHARGVRTDSEHIVIGTGNNYLLMLLMNLLSTHTGKKCTVAMERPTYVSAYRLFRETGLDTVTCGMDENGILVEELGRLQANIAYVMPSHHFPMGTVMSIGRRYELLKWAAEKPDRYLIEDDYDSEFRYRGKPIPSLQGIDRHEKVIYIGTFSKSIAPALRISYMVLPDHLLTLFRKGIGQTLSGVSRIDQQIVSSFMDGGHFERHLNRMRAIYKNKREVLLAAMKEEGLPGTIFGDTAGLHLLLNLGERLQEKEALLLAKEKGVLLYGFSEFFIDGKTDRTDTILIMGYAGLREEEIREGIHALHEAWETYL